jgi:hypothetical protein
MSSHVALLTNKWFTGLCTFTEQDEQYIVNIKLKGKDLPITGHEGPEGE